MHPSLFPWGVRPVRRLGDPPPPAWANPSSPGVCSSADPGCLHAQGSPRLPSPHVGGFPQTTSALWWLIRVAAREGRTGCRFGGGRSSAEAATHFTDKDTKIARGRSRLYLSQECRLALPGLVQRGWGWAVMWSEDPWAVGQRTLNQTAWGLQAWGDALSGHRFVPIWKEKESETAERTKLSVGKGPWGRCGVH